MGIAAIGELKSPWTEVQGGEGVGNLGAFLYDDIEDKVQCHACGNWFKQITALHLRSKNCCGQVFNIREYKVKYGFPLDYPLCTPGISEKRVRIAIKSIAQGNLQPYKPKTMRTKQCSRMANEARQELRSGSYHTIYARNKKRICHAQLKAAVLGIQNNLGHVPKQTELPFHLFKVLRHRYGTYNEALYELGVTKEARTWKSRYTDKELLEKLRSFKLEHGRAPVRSDCRRGILPSGCAYRNHFGSWSRAKKLAGV